MAGFIGSALVSRLLSNTEHHIFNIDLNGDEIIGPSFTVVESEGTATFAKYADGTYWIIDQDNKFIIVTSIKPHSSV